MELSRCETVADVLVLLEEDCSGEDTWQTFFTGVLDATGLSYGRFAARCGLSKNTVKRWSLQGGAPKSRDTYLKVGFGAAMTPEAVSAMLSRYGGYCGLNPRDSFDACCIFCLRKQAAGERGYDYAAAEDLYRNVTAEEPMEGPSTMTTTTLMSHLATVDTEREFQSFLQEFGPELTGRKQKLERYLEEYLTAYRLAAVAHDIGAVVPELSLHSSGREPGGAAAAGPESPDRLGVHRAVAWRCLEFRPVGPLLWLSADSGKAVAGPSSGTPARYSPAWLHPAGSGRWLGAVCLRELDRD